MAIQAWLQARTKSITIQVVQRKESTGEHFVACSRKREGRETIGERQRKSVNIWEMCNRREKGCGLLHIATATFSWQVPPFPQAILHYAPTI